MGIGETNDVRVGEGQEGGNNGDKDPDLLSGDGNYRCGGE